MSIRSICRVVVATVTSIVSIQVDLGKSCPTKVGTVQDLRLYKPRHAHDVDEYILL